MFGLSVLQKATLSTLAYSDIFDFPLKPDEVFLYLISDQPFKQDEISEALVSLKQQGLIGEREGFFFLKDREEICDLRKKREEFSKEKLIKAKRVVWFFRLIPWIRLVAVTGAAAAGNADEESDIDLMIIADTRRIWLTRFLVLGLLKVLGLRVDLKRELVRDRFCLNLFMTDDNLEYPQKDLYTANEIARIKPILERNDFYQRFLKANQWTLGFLPDFSTNPRRLLGFVRGVSSDKPSNRSRFGFLNFLEKIVQDWQTKKIRQNFPQASGLSDDELLAFQPNDCSQKILGEFEKRRQKLEAGNW